MTLEEAVAMLKDKEQPLDIDALVAFIEAQGKALSSALSVYDLEGGELALLPERIAGVEQRLAEVSSLTEQLEARKEKLKDRIIGRMEVLKKDAAAIERFKTRAASMGFEDLDAELEELDTQLQEAFKVGRVSQPADNVDQPLILRPNIGDYRV